MDKTGERYTAARAMLLKSPASSGTVGDAFIRGLFEGYSCVGGVCRDTGAMRNVLAQAGVVAPHTGEALSEAMLYGLCGGVGFLYAVFEYKGMPPMLSVLTRYDSMSDTFVVGGIERLGAPMTVHQTGSAAKARRTLDETLAAGTPSLCTVDCAALRGDPADSRLIGCAPAVVGVAGVDGDSILLDDGAVEPLRLSADQFATARGAYKKGKHRLITINRDAASPSREELGARVVDAARATALRYTHAPYKGFASNMGLAGIAKWRRLLTDTKQPKSWPNLFAGGARACMALRRAFEGIEHEFTPPAGGRPMYADFLSEAAELTGDSAFRRASDAYRCTGKGWRAVSDFVAGCGAHAVETCCEQLDRYAELLDSRRVSLGTDRPKLSAKPSGRGDAAELDGASSVKIFNGLAECVAEAERLEIDAHRALVTATN